jgi:hypothetical protein
MPSGSDARKIIARVPYSIFREIWKACCMAEYQDP